MAIAVVGRPTRFRRAVLTGGDNTNTSTTLRMQTGVTVTITTGAGRFRLPTVLLPPVFSYHSKRVSILDVDIDGVRQGNTANGLMMYQILTVVYREICLYGQSALTAGPHTIKLQWAEVRQTRNGLACLVAGLDVLGAMR